jgi:formate/nitrite transporter FocA (FNT family)
MAIPPQQIADRVMAIGANKGKADALTIFVLAVLAGAFIALGSLFFIVVTTGNPSLGFGINRLMGGVCFSLGLVLVVVGGAELFTGNNLLAMAWASGSISTRDFLRHRVAGLSRECRQMSADCTAGRGGGTEPVASRDSGTDCGADRLSQGAFLAG